MPIRPISHSCRILLTLLVFILGLVLISWMRVQALAKQGLSQDAASEPTVESVFASAPFDQWKKEGPRQELPWKINMSANQLSFHQRLIALLQIQFPVRELLQQAQDDHITFLVEVRNGQGLSARNSGVLDLNKLTPEMKRTDVEYSWVAFAVPGQYEVSMAMWDKKSGKHNFTTRLFHVDAYNHDPLPEMWNGLDVFEFWGSKRDGPEYLYHSDIEGRLNLPLKTKRPIDLEVLLDLTPASDIFRGNIGLYNRYQAGVVPMFKVMSQINVMNGTRNAAVLDLTQKRLSFDQTGGKDLDWASLRKTLSPDNSTGTVSVQDLQNNKKQSPVFLREEIVRRLSNPATHAIKGGKPLHVFVLIGGPMDLYSFPQLPAIETGNEEDCLIYYLQFNFFEHHAPRQRRFDGRDRLDRPDRFDPPSRLHGFNISGNVGEVEKMLKPLKMRAFQVQTADEVRHALAKIMEELGQK